MTLGKFAVVFPFHTALVVLHVMAVSVGLGAALMADWIVARRLLFSTVDAGAAAQISNLAKVVAVGLVVIWATGLYLVSHNLYSNPDSILRNGKFGAKIVIVGGLTLNALLLHFVVLRRVGSRVGQALFEDGLRWESVVATLAGAISAVSWIAAAYLGVAREWNRVVPAGDILAIYAPLILIVWGGGLCLVGVSSLVRAAGNERSVAAPPASGDAGASLAEAA